MNSVIQALAAAHTLTDRMIAYIKKNLRCIDTMNVMTREFVRLIVMMTSASINPHTPRQFKQALDTENRVFRGSRQHDANEFIVYLINEMADEKNLDYGKLIRDTCFGKYKQYVRCTDCKNTVENYFNFLDIQLPIPGTQQTPDLVDCFNLFAQYETLDGDNKWNCPKCGKKVIARKKMEIIDVPDVAVFTFNRFKKNIKNNQLIKLYHNIDLEGKKLKLVATVNHYGTMGGGHYTARVFKSGSWFDANDASVRPIDRMQVTNDPAVYMAIYEVER